MRAGLTDAALAAWEELEREVEAQAAAAKAAAAPPAAEPVATPRMDLAAVAGP